jgi:hypothetical protein
MVAEWLCGWGEMAHVRREQERVVPAGASPGPAEIVSAG